MKLINSYFLRFIIIYMVLNLAYFGFALFISRFTTLDIPLTTNGYISIHKQNDTYWYEKIYTNGYPKITDPIQFGYNIGNGREYKLSEWAFFPMYPLFTKALSAVTSFNFDASNLILSFIFGILTFFSFFLLCNQYIRDKKISFYCTLVFIFFPFHFYYSMFYTEAIFFSLLAFAFLSLKYRKYLIFCLLTIPLVLLRPNGLVLLLPFYIYFLEQNGIFQRFTINSSKINSRVILLSTIFFVGFLAFGAYLWYQYQKTGHYFAFSKAQVGWNKKWMFPAFAFFRENDSADIINSLYTFFVIILSLFVWKRFPLSLNVFVWITLLMPLMAGSTVSIARYISILFPVFIVIGEYFYKFKYKYAILACLFFLQLVLFKAWLFAARISY